MQEKKKPWRAVIPVLPGVDSWFSPVLKSNQTLIVFVHGFRGKALRTWLDFPDFMNSRNEIRHSDALFYGYCSRQQMQNIAIKLRKHLDSVWFDHNTLGPVVSDFLSRRENQDKGTLWRRVIFVAHSLGAVVVRRALLDCFRDDKKGYDKSHWSRCSSLCLFAPAHTGATTIALIGETFSMWKLPVLPGLKKIYPCLWDIERDCLALRTLQEHYKSLPDEIQRYARASTVVISDADDVVSSVPFENDPAPEEVNGRNHIKMCKPEIDFVDPVDFVCDLSNEVAKENYQN